MLSTAPRYEDDGDAETMITDVKPKRGRPRKKATQNSDDLLMAGAIGPSDEPVPISDVPTTTDELAKSDAAPAPVARGNRRPARTLRKVAQNEAQTKVLDGLKQRMAATARGQRAKETTTSDAAAPSSESLPATIPARNASTRKTSNVNAERSEFSLSPSPPPPGKLSAVKAKRSSIAQPGSVLRTQSTPAVETSILALKNFKRRPRQPSMLAMVQQRTASARPSAVHTDIAIEDSSIYDLDLDLDDEDDFAPEAEGTPLNTAKNKRKSSASTGSRAKRRRSAMDDAPDDAGGDTFAAPDEDEIVVAARSSSRRAETPQPVETSDAQTARAPSSSTPPTEHSSPNEDREVEDVEVIVPSTERDERDESEREESVVIPSTDRSTRGKRGAGTGVRDNANDVEHSGIDVPNGTMAEPASSSPIREEPRSTQYNLDMADPVTQVSPPRVRTKAKKQKPVSTATLQSLLPKRRKVLKPRQRKSEYDMASESDDEDEVLDVSHLENDEDELGGEVRRRAPSKARGKAASGKKAGKGSKAATSAVRQSTAARSRKASAPPVSKRNSRTYGRGANSDKENDEASEFFEEADESILPDVSISMQDAASGKELEQAKQKFAEVDDWDMEFESMSQEDHRSSSQGWR